jgi:hypothetical protein
MLANKVRASTLIMLLAASAQAQQMVLPESITVEWINAPDVFDRMTRCTPGIARETVSDIQNQAPERALVYFRPAPPRPYLLAMVDRFACIQRTADGRPLLPASLFKNIVHFDGASLQTESALYVSLATQVASRGKADALVKMSSGNAVAVRLSVIDNAPSEINFAADLVESGQFDETKFTFVIADQIQSFGTATGGQHGHGSYYILQDYLAPRPLNGNYLAARGNRQTAEYQFEGTNWKTLSGGLVSFEKGGVLRATPRRGAILVGSWLCTEGVLYINYKKVYGTAKLEVDGRLFVEYRNLEVDSTKAASNEIRWVGTLEKLEL